jgi:single-stranded DNA-binding protein
MFCNMTIVGNLAADATEKNGWQVFRVGVRPMPKSETIWITVRTKAQWCGSLTKGTRVLVHGTPDMKIWNSNTGPKMDVTLFANGVVSLSPREAVETTPATQPPMYPTADDDSDIPF